MCSQIFQGSSLMVQVIIVIFTVVLKEELPNETHRVR